MPSEARQKKIVEKLNRAQKCSILGPQNLGSGGGPGPPGPPPWIRTCDVYGHAEISRTRPTNNVEQHVHCGENAKTGTIQFISTCNRRYMYAKGIAKNIILVQCSRSSASNKGDRFQRKLLELSSDFN